MMLDWERYEREGFLRLGTVLTDTELAALQARIDAIMLGRADAPYDQMLMQLDSATGKYEDMGAQSKGHKGASLAYRKIQDLELDPLFRDFAERPLFREICAHVYGVRTPIACFRAMFMNKPAHQGTWLPWHQDRWSHLDRDPLITVWTALDPATRANGCVQLIPGSHKNGLVNPDHGSGFVRADQAEVLLDNWTLHASDVNHSDISRRAFSVCYMDANTRGGS